jgi:hypothetical protein
MGIALGTRLDVSLAEDAARRATDTFHKAGDDIGGGLSGVDVEGVRFPWDRA